MGKTTALHQRVTFVVYHFKKRKKLEKNPANATTLPCISPKAEVQHKFNMIFVIFLSFGCNISVLFPSAVTVSSSIHENTL